MSDKDRECIDACDGFLDLYRSVSKFNEKERITLDQYHYINDAIECARVALHLLTRAEANEDRYFTEQRDDLREKLGILQRMSKYFGQEDRVIYKPMPAKKMEKVKKDKQAKELNEFYHLRNYFIGYCYGNALLMAKKDTITMTQYSDLTTFVESGKEILRDSFYLTKGNPDKKFLEDRIDFIHRVCEVMRIRKAFFKGPKNVILDYEWVDRDWRIENM